MKNKKRLVLLFTSIIPIGFTCLENEGAKGTSARPLTTFEKEDGQDSGNDYSPSKLAAIGRGVDATKNGPYAYDGIAIENDIFDRTWLNGYYKKGNYETFQNGWKYDIAEDYSVKNIEDDFTYKMQYSSGAEFSWDFVKAQLTADMGFSTTTKVAKNETSYIFTNKATRTTYSYGLPGFYENQDLITSHVSSYFISQLQSAYSNYQSTGSLQVFYPFFESFGTHIAWKAEYGGALDILFSAHSKTVDLVNEITSSISADIKASVDFANASANSGTSVDVANKLNVHKSQITSKYRGRFYGGKPGSSNIGRSAEAIVNSSNNWLSSIEQDPALIKYKKLIPIEDCLPTNMRYMKSVVANAEKSYYQNRANFYKSLTDKPVNFDGSDVTDTFIILSEQNTKKIGDYKFSDYVTYDERIDLTSGCFYDIETLKTLGYDTITINPIFTLKTTDNDKPVVTVKVNCISSYTLTYNLKNGRSPWTYNSNNLKMTKCFYLSPSNDRAVLEGLRNYTVHFETDKKAWGFFGNTKEAEISNFSLKITYSTGYNNGK